jgi:hypothetical protein
METVTCAHPSQNAIRPHDDARQDRPVERLKGGEHVADQLRPCVERDARFFISHQLPDLVVATRNVCHNERAVLARGACFGRPPVGEPGAVKPVSRFDASPVGLVVYRVVERQRQRGSALRELHGAAHPVPKDPTLIGLLQEFLRLAGPEARSYGHAVPVNVVESEGDKLDLRIARTLCPPFVFQPNERAKELCEAPGGQLSFD